jgi:hypothetical protein
VPKLDKKGYPWDERIHGKAKNINKDGSWRLIKKIDKDLVAQVRAETDAERGAEPKGSPDVNTDDPWVCDQCGVAGGSCEHNENGQFGVIRMSEYKPVPQEGTHAGTILNKAFEQREPPKPQAVTADLVIEKFIETRDEIAELEKKHKAKILALKDVQEKRSMWLSGELKRQGLESFKAASGTCFKDKKDRANVADGAAFMKWVGAEFEKRKHFLENRVSKAAVKQRLEDKKLSPPGINYATFEDVKIRRA